MSNEKRYPAETLRDGSIKATIWKNEGENGAFYSVSLTRTYTDKDGNPHDVDSFSGTQLLQVAELGKKAYRTCQTHRTADKVVAATKEKAA
jgi:hypothetical protein